MRLYVIFRREANCHPLLNILDIRAHLRFGLRNYRRFLTKSGRIWIVVSRCYIFKLFLQTDLTSVIRHFYCLHLGKLFVNLITIKVMHFNMLTIDVISWLIKGHRLWTLHRAAKQVFILGGHM